MALPDTEPPSPPSQAPACILHLDVDAFFAAVEQRDDPRLRGRPVAVGTGVVASCSYESRPHGVRTGMRLTDARRLCPSLVVLPGDYRRYELAGRRILGICHEHTFRVEMAALDDLYLDLARHGFTQAAQVGRAIARQVHEEVGLRVSLGLGTSKLVAGVATQEVKERKARRGAEPGGDLVVVPPGREEAYLAPWPAEVLPGVGHKAADELARLNVRRVDEVAAMPVAVLLGLFGPRGKTLRDLARGIDPRPVTPERPAQSVSRCTSFDPAVCERPFLSAMLGHLVERAALSLRLHGQAAKGLTVRIRHADHQWAEGRAALRPPSNDDAVLKEAARARLERLYIRRLPLRLLGVELSPLTAIDRQSELFPDPEAERRQRLGACKDDIRQRFGFLSLVSGTALQLGERLEQDRDNYRLRTPCLTR
jgi:DNA polymerase-4